MTAWFFSCVRGWAVCEVWADWWAEREGKGGCGGMGGRMGAEREGKGGGRGCEAYEAKKKGGGELRCLLLPQKDFF